ncbi:hypothetical protein AYI69_g3268, partial [Smittium culicis]
MKKKLEGRSMDRWNIR